jgi:transcriptional regulator with XRE-family HTH domain
MSAIAVSRRAMRIATVEDIADAVRSSRQERGWTQAQLAERSGVSRDLVNRLERGSRRVEIAKVLDVLAGLDLTPTLTHRPVPVDLAVIVRDHGAGQ